MIIGNATQVINGFEILVQSPPLSDVQFRRELLFKAPFAFSF